MLRSSSSCTGAGTHCAAGWLPFRHMSAHSATDSEYLQRGITEWLAKWQQKNWRTQARKPVANRDLWEQLLDAEKRHTVQWLWVRGHNGDARNERVDRLARSAIPN